MTILGHRLRQRSGSVCQQSANGGWVDSGRLVSQKVVSSVLVTILRHRLRPRSGSGCQQPRMVDGSTTSHLPHLNRGRVSSGLQAVLPRRGRWVVMRVSVGAGLGVLHTWATRAVGDIGSRARLRPGCDLCQCTGLQWLASVWPKKSSLWRERERGRTGGFGSWLPVRLPKIARRLPGRNQQLAGARQRNARSKPCWAWVGWD